jgi:hypothetical protein
MGSSRAIFSLVLLPINNCITQRIVKDDGAIGKCRVLTYTNNRLRIKIPPPAYPRIIFPELSGIGVSCALYFVICFLSIKPKTVSPCIGFRLYSKNF